MGGKIPRLTKNSSAVQLLRIKTENRELTGRKDPKAVSASGPAFWSYSQILGRATTLFAKNYAIKSVC